MLNSTLPFDQFGTLNKHSFQGLPVYGQYGGPGYTGGEIGGSDYSIEPIDDLDEMYRQHDYGYGLGHQGEADRRLADKLWARGNYTQAMFWYAKSHFGDGEAYEEVAPAWVLREAKKWSERQTASIPPQAPLVGVEPNPGPKRASNKRKPRGSSMSSRLPRNMTVSRTVANYANNLVVTNKYPDMHIARGMITLGTITTPASTSVGTIIAVYDLNPFEIGGRLSRFAQLYQRYRFMGGNIIYNPIASGATGGQLMLTRDTDDSLYPQAAKVNVFEESEKLNRMTVSVRDTFSMKLNAQPGLLWTHEDDSEPRTTSPGFVTVVDRSGLTNSTPYGTLDFEYFYEFSIPANREPPQQLLLNSSTAPAAIATSVFPLNPNGTDDLNASTVLVGDNQWENFVYPESNQYIKIPAWTQFKSIIFISGTGLSATAQLSAQAVNITTIQFTSLINSASTHMASYSGYTKSSPGYLRIAYAGTVTTITARQFDLHIVDYSITLPATFYALGDDKKSHDEEEVHVIQEPSLMEEPFYSVPKPLSLMKSPGPNSGSEVRCVSRSCARELAR